MENVNPRSFQPSDLAKSLDMEEFIMGMGIDSVKTFTSLFEDLVRARQEGVPYFNSRYTHCYFLLRQAFEKC